MRSFIQGLLALALVGVIGVWAVGQFGAGNLRFAPSAVPVLESAPTTVSLQTSAPTVEAPTSMASAQDEAAAVQQVIERGNQAQVEAIAARDPSPMASTATSDHYRQLVGINADLLDNGVTRIALVNLEWGAVNVN